MSPEPSTSPLSCPKCGSTEIIGHGKRYALYPAGCFWLLAMPMAWVHRLSTPYDFECGACGQRFARRTVPAKIALAALWAGVIILVAWFVIAALRP